MAGSTAVTGQFHIFNVINAAAGQHTINFNDQPHLDQITIPGQTALNLAYPIHCTNFTPSNAALIIVYSSGIR
jgi:hypothetical protein